RQDRRRGPIEIDPGLRAIVRAPVRPHAADEEVQDAAEILVERITAEATPQIPVQRDGVDELLQVAALSAHRAGDALARVIEDVVAKVIRFPVDDEIPAVVLED